MRPEELLRILRKKPFKPIRICTSDGAAIEVHHPDQVLVYPTRVEIALDPNPKTGVWGRSETITPLHIARVEILEASTPGA
jgi:hypothetical protein